MSLINRIKIYALIPALSLIWFVSASFAGQFKISRVTDGDTLKAETEAKDSKLNIWSLGNQYISPKEWRKIHK